MKLTKFEHSAMVVEISGDKLVIDPGSFTTPITDLTRVVAIVITHEHPDHWTPEQLTWLLKDNPDVRIFAPAGVVAAASGFDITTVAPGETVEVEPFTLQFFGGKHAQIHASIPLVDNVGVLVNDVLYYGGDSFTIPEGIAVDTLAVPAGAPWLKIGEVMDYVLAIAPKRSFPVHEMLLSTAGKGMSNARIDAVTKAGGGEFFPLEPGQTLDL
jgi:L-ascorbate metabolism protein UlaG (beta-lactamase superfamily)